MNLDLDERQLEKLIKKVLLKELGNNKEKVKQMDPSGVGLVKGNKIDREKFDTGNPNDEVYVTDVFSLEESPRIGAGIMEMTKSTFDWELNYDEIDYIIEGTLKIIIDGREIVGHKGDVILIPKGSKIKFSAPEYAKFLYSVYPANWQEQK